MEQPVLQVQQEPPDPPVLTELLERPVLLALMVLQARLVLQVPSVQPALTD